MSSSDDVFEYDVGRIRVTFEKQDLLKTECDALVNPTNPTLENAGVLSTCLKNVCPTLVSASKAYLQDRGPLQADEVVPIRPTPHGIILSVVSPARSKYPTRDKRVVILSRVIFNAIRKADELGCSSIGIPPVASGGSDVSVDECAQSYWNAVRRCSLQHGEDLLNLTRIRFVDTSKNVVKFVRLLEEFRDKEKNERQISTSDETPFAALSDVVFCDGPGCRKAMSAPGPYRLPDNMPFCEECLKAALLNAKKLSAPYIEQPPPASLIGKKFKQDQHFVDYPKDGVIEMKFSMPAGYQRGDHPHPGTPYSAVDLTAYLPNDKKGKELSDKIGQLFSERKLFSFDWSYRAGRKTLLVPRVPLISDVGTITTQGKMKDYVKSLERQINDLLK